jgi:methylenetetrahydrofolate dehydrogenase (NADP+) / methenyltetrahydrofolate cyclohydrolase
MRHFMPAHLIDGKALAATMQAEIAARVAEQVAAGGPRPGLAAVQVGERLDSTRYVRGKIRACEKVGIASFHHPLPADTTEQQLLALIARLNDDPAVHGILVQLPLPRHIDESTIINCVNFTKDVDGFHPVNLGRLVAGEPGFVACTPLGVQQLLMRNNIAIAGAHAVVIGRSNIVGKPLALLLMRKGPGGDATVTVAHSRSRDLKEIARAADILIAAAGQPGFVTADMVKPGAAVIDVGTTPSADGRLVGDVDFAAVSAVAGAISPVPGGVGPMTITMLLHNTLRASQMRGNFPR